jgi:hypothetical protein
MSSRSSTLLDVRAIALQASVTFLDAVLPSAFGRIIGGDSAVFARPIRDLCNRPPVFYNNNYDPTKPPSHKLAESYSSYDWNKPLFDNRSAIVASLPL